MTQSQSASHELHDLSVHALTQALAAKQVSAVEVAQHFLDRAAPTPTWVPLSP
jgi:Asp-tRNA(Asn)/Glu-tRNA(Gln) amidotransferase A subunit family amidase